MVVAFHIHIRFTGHARLLGQKKKKNPEIEAWEMIAIVQISQWRDNAFSYRALSFSQ